MILSIKGIIALLSGIGIIASVCTIWRVFHNDTMESDKDRIDEENKQKSLRTKKNHVILIWALVGILCLWFFSWMLIDLCYQQGTGDRVGTFGDKFGAVNALFSGLAFAGLIMTLVLQKEELEAQREELKQTRMELEGQKQEFEIQNKTLKQQQFATTFFQLLSALQKSIDNLEIPCRTDSVKGIRCFKFILNRIEQELSEERGQYIPRKKAEEIYKGLYDDFYYPMGTFFRSYYRLIKYVVISDLDDNEKYQYISFARAQLSDDIISVLFYNFTIGYGRGKFKKMAEKWVLLKNLPSTTFIFEEMKDWIDNDAYRRKGRYGEDEEIAKMNIN